VCEIDRGVHGSSAPRGAVTLIIANSHGQAHHTSRKRIMTLHSGRHFLQIPGPTNVPERVLRAIDSATIDHRGPEFQKLGQEVLNGLKAASKTKNPVIISPASGTGGWEAAMVNPLSSGDRVLMYETGHFASL